MKKLVFLLACTALFAGSISAQSTSPRPAGNRSFTVVTTVDAAGADTITLYPTEFQTYIIPSTTITDTVCYRIGNVSQSAVGDELIFMGTNSSGSGHKIKLVGTSTLFWVSGSDTVLALTSAKKYVIKFIMDRSGKWVEEFKMVQ